MDIPRTLVRSFGDWPLRPKVAMVVAIGSLLPLLLTTLLSFQREDSQLRQASLALLEARADQVALSLQNRNQLNQTTVSRFARRPDVERFCAASPADRVALAPMLFEQERSLSQEPDLLTVALFDKTGRVISSSKPSDVGRDLSFRPYFKTAIAGSLAVFDLFLGIPDGSPAIAYASPVSDGNGGTGCVAAISVSAASFWSILRESNGSAGRGSYSILFDHFGIRIGHSYDDKLLFRPAAPLPEATLNEMVTSRRFGEQTEKLLRQPIVFKEIAQAEEGRYQVFNRNSAVDHLPYIGVVRKLPVNGWILVSMLPEAVTRAPRIELVRQVALAGALGLLLALAGAALVLRGVVRPIRELALTARALESGNPGARVRVLARDEVGMLAASFNQMAAHLQSERAQLEDKSRELVAARDAAMQASHHKSEFLATMSHEIRTPLNGVIGMLGLLLQSELGEQQRAFAETARSSGEALLQVINDILDFSKIEAGRLELETVDFSLRQMFDELMDVFVERASRKRLELRGLVHTDVPDGLRGDPGRLRQVLNNLIGNALKFTEEGQVVVEVRRVESADDAVLIRFEVKDTGIGLAPESRERLFKSFSQVDASTTRRFGGTGLGLAISRQLAESMGGEIGVESELGEGSCFWFTARLGVNLAAAAPEDDGAMAGLRVLVADDNETNRTIFHHQLRSWRMEDVAVAGGAEALVALRANRFDLAIVDHQMPGMDGLALVREIRKEPALASLGIVMATSFGHPEQMEEARRAGADACVVKPLRQSQLLDALLKAHAARTSGAHAAEAPRRTPPVARPEKMLGRVLVAEDNIVNQQVAVFTLARLGYRADVAADGREVLAALEKISYDAIFMDCQMPQMDGFQATAEIRRREGGARRTPIIAMTANALKGDREKCLAAGMDDYLSKPIRPELVALALQRWIGKGSGAAAPAVSPAADGSVLDEAKLRALVGGDSAFLGELVRIFLEDSVGILEELRAAAAQEDADRLRYAAHKLKGSTGSIFGARAAAAALRLEELASESRLEEAKSACAAVESEVELLRKAMASLTGANP